MSFFGQQATASSTPFGQTQQSQSPFGQNSQPQQGQSSGLFGQTSQPQQGGGLFGQSQPQQGGGLFGQSQPQQSGGMFGQSQTSQPQQSGGLFGQRQPQQSSLFGQSQTSQPQQSGGLFGSQPQQSGQFGQTSQPQQGGGLFGQTQPQQSGLFGQTQSQPSSLFGQSQQPSAQFGQSGQSGLFGQQTSQPSALFGQSKPAGLFGQSQPQQSTQNTSLFGQSQQNTSMFGQSQPQPSSFLGQQPFQQSYQQSYQPQPPQDDIQASIMAIKNAWDPSSPDCRFKHYFYNLVHPSEVSRYNRPQNQSPEAWKDARDNNPDPTCMVPALAVGFDDVAKRTDLQVRTSTAHSAKLEEITKKLSALQQSHQLNTSVKLKQQQQRHSELSRRLLVIAAKINLVINNGYPIRPEEEAFKARIEQLHKQVSKPGQFRGRINDLWAQIRILKDVAASSQARGWEVVDENQLGAITNVLSSQQAGLNLLIDTLKEDKMDAEVLAVEV